ncbi:MAG: NACHT domain-containing protein [Calditrichaeota bacterium]|nr:MAG: NACHT domain-containing protein [Calditrichota bacterium]
MPAKRTFLTTVFLGLCIIIFCTIPSLAQQDSSAMKPPVSKMENKIQIFSATFTVKEIGLIISALIAIWVAVFFVRRAYKTQIAKNRADKDFAEEQTTIETASAKEIYQSYLRTEHGFIRIMGDPNLSSQAVELLKVFVQLEICWMKNHDELKMHMIKSSENKSETHPLDFIHDIFKKKNPHDRRLLIIGDPGSGKSTLMKYLTMACLKGEHKRLGYSKPVMPLFLVLRSLQPDKNLPENFEAYGHSRQDKLTAGVFRQWLDKENTLVLLDGLDEISDRERRQQACEWIDRECKSYPTTRFIITTRPTGYRKIDNIELEPGYAGAEVKSFSPKQRKKFLENWFEAIYSHKPEKVAMKVQGIVDYLNAPGNESLAELASVPIILQVMAIIWDKTEFLPETRSQLYNAALDHLLSYRPRRKNLNTNLSKEDCRKIIEPVALQMQQERKDVLPKEGDEGMHMRVQHEIDGIDDSQTGEDFCLWLQDVPGLITEYENNAYIFRHKSFREYFAAVQWNKILYKPGEIEKLVACFIDDDGWQDDMIRFLFETCDGDIFDEFIRVFFQNKKSHKLDKLKQDVLWQLIREAKQTKTDALQECLQNPNLSAKQQQFLILCIRELKNKKIVLPALQKYVQAPHADKDALVTARVMLPQETTRFFSPTLWQEKPEEFICVEENAAEYNLIPGGKFNYSVSQKEETVPDTYFARYPLTFSKYRRFIRFLQQQPLEGEKPWHKKLPVDSFVENFLLYAKKEKWEIEYVGENRDSMVENFISFYDNDKKWNSDEQPVVGVSWYAACAYCYWLSLLTGNDPAGIGARFRLPTEIEWEWAAAGRTKNGAMRIYPWGDESSDLENRANFGENVGKTTPVGTYPGGATPEGLLDMAGNVWEWQENWYDDDKDVRALRGGSWNNLSVSLRCSVRVINFPRDRLNYFGFRVVFCQS